MGDEGRGMEESMGTGWWSHCKGFIGCVLVVHAIGPTGNMAFSLINVPCTTPYSGNVNVSFEPSPYLIHGDQLLLIRAACISIMRRNPIDAGLLEGAIGHVGTLMTSAPSRPLVTGLPLPD